MLISSVSTHTFLKLQTHNIILESSSSSSSSSSRLVFSRLPSLPSSSFLKLKCKLRRENGIPRHKESQVCTSSVAKAGLEEKPESWVGTLIALLIVLIPTGYTYAYTPPSLASLEIDEGKGAALFRNACIGCHVAGGNIIQPGATLFANDLERNGVAGEDEIYNITYNGKGRMPGFGEKCMPRGQCTFGPRLQEEDIRVLARFVKSQADQGWPTLP
ncbi:hypothetical protein RND81_06G154400 [Saponaria officinalis]